VKVQLVMGLQGQGLEQQEQVRLEQVQLVQVLELIPHIHLQ
jgi:hypothetical protein